MSAPDILFKGIPRGYTRGYSSDYLASVTPEHVVIPCVGSFALVRVAIDAGIPPSHIFCGDISLYSTAIGNAIQSLDWRLELTGTGRETCPYLESYLTDPISKAAAVLYMIRVLQYNKKHQNLFQRDLQRELLTNWETYILQVKEQVAAMRDDLKGLTYRAQDMWITLDQFKDRDRTVLLVNPPRYDGGYDRMFKGIDALFDWDTPEAAMFKEKDYARLMELLGPTKAVTLMYYATQGEDPAPTWGDPWRSVFADRPGNKRVAAINWIVSNQSPIPHRITRARLPDEKGGKYLLFKGEIKPDSLLVAMTIDPHVGDYYRDLFIHKLPGSLTERYVGLFVDGSLMAIVGLHVKDLRIRSAKSKSGRRGNITFAFTVPHEQYSRLHKLTLMAAVSSWFWDDALGHENAYDLLATPLTVGTVMLTDHPENKTARGVLKLVEREQQKDGTFKLHYTAEIVKRTREETVRQWISKFNQPISMK